MYHFDFSLLNILYSYVTSQSFEIAKQINSAAYNSLYAHINYIVIYVKICYIMLLYIKLCCYIKKMLCKCEIIS